MLSLTKKSKSDLERLQKKLHKHGENLLTRVRKVPLFATGIDSFDQRRIAIAGLIENRFHQISPSVEKAYIRIKAHALKVGIDLASIEKFAKTKTIWQKKKKSKSKKTKSTRKKAKKSTVKKAVKKKPAQAKKSGSRKAAVKRATVRTRSTRGKG